MINIGERRVSGDSGEPMAWSQFRKTLFSGDTGSQASSDASCRETVRDAAPRAFEARAFSLDDIGKRSEAVKQQIEAMVDRLEDMKSLQTDFSSIISPLAAMADELSRSSVRVTELEALLTQERQTSGTARRELG